MVLETKKRSFIKSVCWRVLAVLNGWGIAYLFLADVSMSFKISFIANITGFVLYFAHERGWNCVEWERK